MNRFWSVLCIFTLLFCSLTGAAAQVLPSSNRSQAEGTVEEFYLQSLEMQILQEQINGMGQDMKLLALSNIAHMMDDGKVSEGDPEVNYLLNLLANEGIGHQIRENNRLVNDFPVVRKEAAALLGRLGGDTAKKSLIQIAHNDIEPMVLSEAVYQLGVIGLNENNEVSTAIADALSRQSIMNPSDNFAYAALLAFQKLAAANGGLKDPNAFRAIITIAQGPYIYEVRVKANEVLNDLRQY